MKNKLWLILNECLHLNTEYSAILCRIPIKRAIMALPGYQMASVPARILAIGGACINFYYISNFSPKKLVGVANLLEAQVGN